MSNTLPKPDDIVKGETNYYFPDLARDLKIYIDGMLEKMKKKYGNDEMYKVALGLVMLSAEEKTVEEIGKAIGQKEEFITVGQEDVYKRQIPESTTVS